ncbi:MAG TPA: hypothetical protein V6D22_16675 [Candidatus Obscuribacterales bacterium]
MQPRHRLPLIFLVCACAAVLWLSAFPQSCSAAVTRCQTIDGSIYKQDNANLIRVTDGQYFISIKGDRKDQSFIITPSLLIRGASATLLVQVSPRRSQVSVLSGSAIVKNLLDRHIVEIHKGTVYSCVMVAPPPSTTQQQNGRFEQVSDPESTIPLFQSAKSHSSLAVVSRQALCNSRFAQMVSADSSRGSNKLPDVDVISPPTVVSYRIGEQLAHTSMMPALLRQHFPPEGLVITPPSLVVAEQNAAK